MKKPLVSILVPVYNVEAYLRQCLESIINQTYDNLQVILIDDGSTDGSYSIMQDYAKNDSRIEIYHQVNQGVSTTRNHLLEKVKGDYVLFVDSDDWLELNAVETITNIQQEGNYDIITFQMGANDQNVAKYDRETAIMHFLEHKTFRGSLWNKAIRAALFSGLAFNQSISYGEDALMTWQILQRVNSVKLIPNRLYNYRMNSASLSHAIFNEKKFSAYYVWEQICSETEQLWPKYLDIAHARYSIEMTLLLLDAARCNYKNKIIIQKMQQVVRLYGAQISRTHISSLKMSAFACLAARSFFITRFFSKYI